MKKTLKINFQINLVNAFLKNKIIPALPIKFTKKLMKLINLENYVKVKLMNQ